MRSRREIDLPGRPSSVELLPGEPSLVAVAIEQTGELLLWRTDEVGDPARVLAIEVGPYPVGPVALPGGWVAVGSMGKRSVALYAPREANPASPRAVRQFDAAPRAMAAGMLEGVGHVLLVAVGPNALWMLRDQTWHGPFELPTERSTAILLAEDGSGLWFGSQSPTALGKVPAKALLDAPGALVGTEQWPLPGIPRALVEADILGTGARTLCVFGGAHDLHWMRPDGALGHLTLPAGVPLAAVTADLERDGVDELLVLSKSDSSYLVLGGFDGQAFRRSFSEYSGQASIDLAAGDLNGDGSLDLLVCNREAQALAVLYGRGGSEWAGGPFHTAIRAPAGRNPLDLALLRQGEDGALGVAAVSGAKAQLLVFANRGGRFEPTITLDTGPSPSRVYSGDLDGDGRDDLVVLTQPTSGAVAFAQLCGPEGEFRERVPLAVGPAATALALVPGPDGASVAVAEPGAGRVTLLDPFHTQSPLSIALGARPQAIARWPGEPDSLAVALGGTQPAIASITRTDAGLVESGRWPIEGYPVDIASGDLDGDQRADVVVLVRRTEGSMEGRVLVYWNRDGQLRPGPRAETGALPHRLALGDLDRDGRVDIAVAAQNRHSVNLWLSRPRVDGQVALARQMEVGVGLGPISVVMGDLTGNGWLDIVSANAFSDDLTTVWTEPPR